MSQRFSNLEPGQTYDGSITIVNPADATENFSYKISLLPYGVSGREYTADLTTDSDYTAIAKWISVEEPTGEVKPNESKEIKFTITVPENAPAGGQYAAIAVSSNNEISSTGGVAVQNVFELASLIYGQVAGETVHEGKILENNIPGFVTSTPVTLGALITNKGNVHEDATFVITVSNFFTGQVILPTEENEGEYNEIIMPDTERYVEREISNLPALGVVKVSQSIYYNGELSKEEKEIIICPIWFMALVALTLAAIITTIVLIVKKHKKNKAKLGV
jgi:hypothetical protein